MAACGSVQHFFEKPLAENPIRPEPFSRWNQIKPVKPTNRPSLTVEDVSISDSSASTSSSSSFDNRSDDHKDTKSSHGCDFTNNITDYFSSSIPKVSNAYSYSTSHRKSCSLLSYTSESLELCTERLGFKGSDDIEDEAGNVNVCGQVHGEKATPGKRLTSVRSFSEYDRRSRSRSAGDFPPPISSLGRDGKPRVSFRYFRQDGRFILKKIRTPSHEYVMHACREDGRLKLQFLPYMDDFLEDEEA